MKFVGDCLEALLDAITEDEDTAIIVGIPLLFLIAPFYLLWGLWPRKKPLEYDP